MGYVRNTFSSDAFACAYRTVRLATRGLTGGLRYIDYTGRQLVKA